MTLEYPTEYKDRRGTEFSKFITDGESMKIELRGIEFTGHFSELTPLAEQLEKAKTLFDLNEDGELSGLIDCRPGANPPDFTLKVKMPIRIITNEDKEIGAEIHFGFSSGEIEFVVNGNAYSFEKPNFEYGLSQEHTTSLNFKYVKCCINCEYAEYSPFGSDAYGDMRCFKNCKESLKRMRMFGLKEAWNLQSIIDCTVTQEAFWCEEFKLKSGKASI